MRRDSFSMSSFSVACGAAAMLRVGLAVLIAGAVCAIPAHGQAGIPVNEISSGQFSDPLAIHLAKTKGSYLPPISGTTQQILECHSTSLTPDCYTAKNGSTTYKLSFQINSTVSNQVAAAGSTLSNYQNNNIYQRNNGTWEMVTTMTVNNASANPGGLAWNVILHASPAAGSATTSPSGVPLSWVVDALLEGSFSTQAPANYDGKFIEDSSNNLYLIYSMRLPTVTQDGIVAQLMSTDQQVDSSSPTATLLAPENDGNGGYNSELFFCLNQPNTFKLIETGNIAIVGGKYAMAYSTGSFEERCYKSGVAWSDTLTGSYKKALAVDTNGVWTETPGEDEVVYLLQSQLSQWPNYEASYVHAPGVPSLVEYPAGTWYMYFAGYPESDTPNKSGEYTPADRQPYYVPLTQAVNQSQTVKQTPATDLPRWLTLTQ